MALRVAAALGDVSIWREEVKTLKQHASLRRSAGCLLNLTGMCARGLLVNVTTKGLPLMNNGNSPLWLWCIRRPGMGDWRALGRPYTDRQARLWASQRGYEIKAVFDTGKTCVESPLPRWCDT